ncbi:MAG: LPS assembly lipoprotein LptE [Planctomycetota bacterium]
MHRRVRLPAFFAVGWAGLAGLTGCVGDPAAGYSFAPLYPADVRSIAVPIWENRAFYPGAEVELTEAIVKEIQRTTDWAVTPSGIAETSLNGAINDIDLETLSIDRDSGLTQEQIVRYRVDFVWQDNRTGEELLRRVDFDGVGSYVPSIGAGERPELGRSAAVDRLARDVVRELRALW